ncbi:thiol reductant ABC exporter subunit CydC [Streptococcus halotolerans]|uniref:thiol reductant ABC exporter subunit CydC n=1 Tax=Streptococcus halotolerans TaxID=1814128 RepID=UPI000786A8A7|nr:thiol reductant ABC exporter subunit CydC [Streptococcus halotolerans]
MFKWSMVETLKKDHWVKPFFKQYRNWFYLALFLGFITLFSGAALMFVSGLLISKSASMPSNILLVYIPIVLTRAFGISRPLFRYLERLTSHNWVLKITSKLRLKLYQSLEKRAAFIKKDFRLGDMLGLLAEDINHLQNLYLRTVFPTLIAWLLYTVIIIGLGYFSWWFALVMLFLLGLLVFVMPVYSLVFNGARQAREKEIKNRLYQELTDNIIGISDWIFSQRGEDYVGLHEASQAELLEIRDKIKRFNRRRHLMFEAIFGLIVTLVLVWASYRFPGNHGSMANWIAAFVLAIFPLADAFAGLSAASQETVIYHDSIIRLNDLDDSVDHEKLSKAPVTRSLDIAMTNLGFHYQDNAAFILKDVNLAIPQGQKVAILGRSGTGKSTLASLIRGDLRASQGSVTLAGIETSDFGDAIAEKIGIMQQNPYLFNTSILNNLRLGNANASEEAIWRVLEQVGLKDMIAKLPHQLETQVDETGLRFSGGERHRLALARILLKQTPIVILDEPTVGLDPVTEMGLINTIMSAFNHQTVIWITHHLKGIEKVDRVLFLEHGQLVMDGNPHDLLSTNERFAQLKAVDDGRFTG